jgi:hypothetical protein
MAARPRTITRKEHAIKPSIVVAVDDIVTPPPPASVADVMTKPASSAARGEITVGTFAARQPNPLEGESVAAVPSVVVELEPLSPTAPIEVAQPAPVSAQAALGTPELARVEIPQRHAPAQPAQPVTVVAIETVIVEAALVEPAQNLPSAAPDLLPATVIVQAASAVGSAPSVVVSALASEPNLAPAMETLAAAVADPATTSSPPPPAAAANRVTRAAIAFSDVEADFFDREADLYKRDSVESFEDLDRKPGAPLRSIARSGTKR